MKLRLTVDKSEIRDFPKLPKVKLILRVIPFLILNRYQLFLLTPDILFQSHHSYKKFENRSVWGACQFQALWPFAEGLYFFINYFYKKEGFF